MGLKIKKYKKRTTTKRHPKKHRSFNGMLSVKRSANMVDAIGIDISPSTAIGLDVINSMCMTFTSSATLGNVAYGSLSYFASLQDVTQYLEFTHLYDQYKIDKVKIRLIPYATGVQSGAAVSSASAQTSIICHSIIDYDDTDITTFTANEAGIDALRQNVTYKVCNLIKKPLTRTFVPRCNTAVSNNSNTLAQKNEPFGWMDSNSPDVAGYGLKMILENVSAGSALTLYVKMVATYYLSFRQPR